MIIVIIFMKFAFILYRGKVRDKLYRVCVNFWIKYYSFKL